jgi:hypothetical protein
MKIADGMKIIETGWVHKPAGFRVRYQTQTENGMETGYSPPPGEAALNSDVTAWRYAWKLSQATRTEVEAGAPGTLFNITVVDDRDNPCRFYNTGDFETYHPKPPSESG